jgi:hypothetical protein
MRLVASSNPGDVDRFEAINLLVQRAILTRNVCRELIDRSDGKFCRWRTDSALGFLMQWIGLLIQREEVYFASDGIDLMTVPDDCYHLVEEIRDGARVCDALAMLQSADTQSDVMNDMMRIEEELDNYWRKHASAAQPPSAYLS